MLGYSPLSTDPISAEVEHQESTPVDLAMLCKSIARLSAAIDIERSVSFPVTTISAMPNVISVSREIGLPIGSITAASVSVDVERKIRKAIDTKTEILSDVERSIDVGARFSTDTDALFPLYVEREIVSGGEICSSSAVNMTLGVWRALSFMTGTETSIVNSDVLFFRNLSATIKSNTEAAAAINVLREASMPVGLTTDISAFFISGDDYDHDQVDVTSKITKSISLCSVIDNQHVRVQSPLTQELNIESGITTDIAATSSSLRDLTVESRIDFRGADL